MRYLKQQDRFRCGPVALLNALKWQGLRVSSSGLGDLCELVQCRDSGTYVNRFHRVAKQLGYRWMQHPNVRKIDKALKTGNAVLMFRAGKGQANGHFSLVIDRTATAYYGVNHTGNRHDWYDRSEFHRRHFSAFSAWVVPPFKVGSLVFIHKDHCA